MNTAAIETQDRAAIFILDVQTSKLTLLSGVSFRKIILNLHGDTGTGNLYDRTTPELR